MKRDRRKWELEEWRKRIGDKGNWRVLIGKAAQESEETGDNACERGVLNKNRVTCLYKHWHFLCTLNGGIYFVSDVAQFARNVRDLFS